MRLIAALSLALLFSTGAHAETYLLFGTGQTWTSTEKNASTSDAELRAAGFTNVNSNTRSDDLPVSIGAGYRFSRQFSLEASYNNFSELHHYGASFQKPGPPGNPNTGAQTIKYSGYGLQLAAIGAWPVSQNLSLIGKAGAMWFKGKYSNETTINAMPTGQPSFVVSQTSDSVSSSNVIPGLGLGVQYQLGGFDVRATLEHWIPKSGMFGAGNDLKKIDMLIVAIILPL